MVDLDAWREAQNAIGQRAVVQRICARKPVTATTPRVRHKDGLTRPRIPAPKPAEEGPKQ